MFRKITNKIKVAMLPVLFILFAVMMDSENLLAEGREIFHYEQLWLEETSIWSNAELYSNDMSSIDAQAWYGGYSYQGTVQMRVELWKSIKKSDGSYESKYYEIPLPLETTYFEEGEDSWGQCLNIPGATPYVSGQSGNAPLPRIRLKLEAKRLLKKDIGYAELVSFYP
ncbi:MAG: hypothetical protein IJY81_07700 [Lachnospiraceae bacterium]|nr:hypothetical protein [Lachnospiraceae bacterium]